MIACVVRGALAWLCNRARPSMPAGKATAVATVELQARLESPYTTTLLTATMASNVEQSPFFQQQKSKGESIVRGKNEIPVYRVQLH